MAKVPSKPSGKGMPPAPINTPGNLDLPEPEEDATLNFKVSKAFKTEFKTYAAQHDKNLVTLLRDAFNFYKAR